MVQTGTVIFVGKTTTAQKTLDSFQQLWNNSLIGVWASKQKVAFWSSNQSVQTGFWRITNPFPSKGSIKSAWTNQVSHIHVLHLLFVCFFFIFFLFLFLFFLNCEMKMTKCSEGSIPASFLTGICLSDSSVQVRTQFITWHGISTEEKSQPTEDSLAWSRMLDVWQKLQLKQGRLSASKPRASANRFCIVWIERSILWRY